MKETLSINDADYERFKRAIIENYASVRPSDEWLEKEKEKKFQNLFKELWPNLYARLNEQNPTAAALLQELERSKMMYDSLIRNEINKSKQTLFSSASIPINTDPSIFTQYPPNTTNTTNTTSSIDSLNISIQGLNTINPRVDISKHLWPSNLIKPNLHYSTYVDSNATNASPIIKYPNQVSSYDFPYSTNKYQESLIKTTYNDDSLIKENELLKSIQDAQEKLKLTQKLEKTTDLVDNIIDKVKLLQTEMKRKSAALEIKNNIEKLKQERRNLDNHKFLHSSLSFNCNDNDDSLFQRRPRLRSKSRDRSSSRERYYLRSGLTPSINTKSNRFMRSNFPSKSYYIQPKVDCWNMNCKHDKNVY
jgi:hypothetical protein